MDEGMKVALANMADSASKRVSAYVSRGRYLKGKTGDELSGLLVAAYRELEAASFDPYSPARTMTDDIEAEYEIRNETAPHHLVKEQIDKLVARARELLDSTTPERLDEINDEMVDNYLSIKRTEN